MTVIVDYDAGNLRSVQRACSEIGVDAEITSDPSRIRHAERIIFPGVGHAGAAMRSIRVRGIDQALLEAFEEGTPILGICIGLQISLDRSDEGDVETLGLIPGRVRRFEMKNADLKVPHMGWNDVQVARTHPILAHVRPGDEFYFVHAYYPEPVDEGCVYAKADYESTFCCALGSENFFGTQFHPEKSGRVGLELIRNFTAWNGTVA
ncbi:MAG: imidazole glycerol phosphate synthase subunit HisH [Gammaproteobacteria bacterium]|nr:imidazole glycerol phosphate synthase subunit HisH [Gammaproteobacteria bacterium]